MKKGEKMRKTILTTILFVILTLGPTQLATSQGTSYWKSNVVTNRTLGDVYVVFTTYRPAKDDIPLGWRTQGWYLIKPGQSHTFHAFDDYPIYYLIYQANTQSFIKPRRAKTYRGWMYRDAFVIVSEDEPDTFTPEAELLYAQSTGPSDLMENHNYFKSANTGSVTVTPTGVIAPLAEYILFDPNDTEVIDPPEGTDDDTDAPPNDQETVDASGGADDDTDDPPNDQKTSLPEDFDDASEMEPTLLTTTRRFTVIGKRRLLFPEDYWYSWDRTVTFPGPVTDAIARSIAITATLGRVTISGNDVTVNGQILARRFIRSQIDVTLNVTYLFESAQADINGDGVVNILDLVSVVSQMGESSEKGDACGPDDCIPGDINWDGVVNILDLVLVAGALGEAAAAPSIRAELLAHLNPAEARQWLEAARLLAPSDAISQKGVAVLEQLFLRVAPKATALLPNYPNPFNPETWIPYHLSEAANVVLDIYAADGKQVWTLVLGHQAAGVYETKRRAAYWDGRNQLGERCRQRRVFLYVDSRRVHRHRKDAHSEIVANDLMIAGRLMFIRFRAI